MDLMKRVTGWWYVSVFCNLEEWQNSMNADWLITGSLESNFQWPRGPCPCLCATHPFYRWLRWKHGKHADQINRWYTAKRERQPTQPNSKMISTGWNNSANLTRKNLMGINGRSCTWVQKSNCVWDGEEVAKQQHLGKKSLRHSSERGTVGDHHTMWMAKLPVPTRHMAMRAMLRWGTWQCPGKGGGSAQGKGGGNVTATGEDQIIYPCDRESWGT